MPPDAVCVEHRAPSRGFRPGQKIRLVDLAAWSTAGGSPDAGVTPMTVLVTAMKAIASDR